MFACTLFTCRPSAGGREGVAPFPTPGDKSSFKHERVLHLSVQCAHARGRRAAPSLGDCNDSVIRSVSNRKGGSYEAMALSSSEPRRAGVVSRRSAGFSSGFQFADHYRAIMAS